MFLLAPEGSGESVSFAGRKLKVVDGVVEVPDCSVAEFISHGFKVAPADKQGEKSEEIKLIDAQMGFVAPTLSTNDLESHLEIAEAEEKTAAEALKSAKEKVKEIKQSLADAKEAAAKKAAKEAEEAAEKAKAEAEARKAALAAAKAANQ